MIKLVTRFTVSTALCVASGWWSCADPSPEANQGALSDAGPRQMVIFVYDRSTSIPDHTLTLANQLTNRRLDELTYGDRIAGMQLLQLSLAEPPRRWSQQVPERQLVGRELMQDSVSRARFLSDAKTLLAQLSDSVGRQNITGTDILSTLHDVAEELRAYPEHEAILYLFSDMLQSNRTIEMEGLRRMPPAGWIAEAEAEGRLPDLTGLCVMVVGARVDTEAAQRIKAFWDEYFETTGATLLNRNYALRPVRLPTDPCS